MEISTNTDRSAGFCGAGSAVTMISCLAAPLSLRRMGLLKYKQVNDEIHLYQGCRRCLVLRGAKRGLQRYDMKIKGIYRHLEQRPNMVKELVRVSPVNLVTRKLCVLTTGMDGTKRQKSCFVP